MSEGLLKRVSTKYLGTILVERGLIPQDQLDEALAYGKQHQIRLGEALVRLGNITADTLSYALAEQYGIRPVELDWSMIDTDLVLRVPAHLLSKHLLLPLVSMGPRTVVLISDPEDRTGLDAIRPHLPTKDVVVQLGNPVQIRSAIEAIHSAPEAQTASVSADHAPETLDDTSPRALLNWIAREALAEPQRDLVLSLTEGQLTIQRLDAVSAEPARPADTLASGPSPEAADVIARLGDAAYALGLCRVPAWRVRSPLQRGASTYRLTAMMCEHIGGVKLRFQTYVDRDLPPAAISGTASALELNFIFHESHLFVDELIPAHLASFPAPQPALLLSHTTRSAYTGIDTLPLAASDPAAVAAALGAVTVIADTPLPRWETDLLFQRGRARRVDIYLPAALDEMHPHGTIPADLAALVALPHVRSFRYQKPGEAPAVLTDEQALALISGGN